MRTLALATGLLLLAITTALGPDRGPTVPESRLWLAVLDGGQVGAGESVLAAAGRPGDRAREFAQKRNKSKN